MMIRVDGLGKTIRGATVLDDISLTLSAGRIYGLTGPNGSGKTMLLRALAGLIRPNRGQVVVDGRRLGREIAFPPEVGVLIERPAFLAPYTAFQNLRLLAMIRRVAADSQIAATLREFGLEPTDRRPFRKFSLGMKQRLGLASAVMERPGLLLLDEPTTALDDAGVESLREALLDRRGQGALIAMASHDHAELEAVADEVFELSAGRVVGRHAGRSA